MTDNSNFTPPPLRGNERVHLALLSFVFAILFASAGLLLPPRGEIDGSVLILVAQLLVLCATFLGIKDYTNIIKKP